MCEVYARRDGREHVLMLTGHATGSEKVCAAASGIVYALAGYLENQRAAGKVKLVEMRLDSGDTRMEWQGTRGTEAAYEMAVIGLAQIAKAEPDYIKVEVGER